MLKGVNAIMKQYRRGDWQQREIRKSVDNWKRVRESKDREERNTERKRKRRKYEKTGQTRFCGINFGNWCKQDVGD